jgi:hypothetical protein
LNELNIMLNELVSNYVNKDCIMDVQEIFRWENGAYANAIGNSGNY